VPNGGAKKGKTRHGDKKKFPEKRGVRVGARKGHQAKGSGGRAERVSPREELSPVGVDGAKKKKDKKKKKKKVLKKKEKGQAPS